MMHQANDHLCYDEQQVKPDAGNECGIYIDRSLRAMMMMCMIVVRHIAEIRSQRY